uniref:TFIIS-type domain-containing protein n=1 Tax=viral metagenome TaxID=1070528 RepID=A0A6C0JEK9_9ZZZZ
MTYTKLKTDSEQPTGLISYCKNCSWEGESETNDKSIYKRNYQEDFIANKIITNKYTIFDVTLPRVDYECTNENCITKKKIPKDVSFMVDNIPADIDEPEFLKIFNDDLSKGNLTEVIRIRLTSALLICKDKQTKKDLSKSYNKIYKGESLNSKEYTKPNNEVLYLKYDNINMRYLYICANCGTSWKKN